MKANRFGAFEDEDAQAAQVKQAQQQVKQQQQQKKTVVKVVKKAEINQDEAQEFERVGDKKPSNNNRGPRGGRGGNRPRGDRPQTGGPRREGGERRDGGDRPRRGRGDRPQTAKPIHAEGEGDNVEKKEGQAPNRSRGGGNRHQGKAREDAHPLDRRDGTGKAHRGDRKGGHGKGNWGKEGVNDAQEESKEERPQREPKPEPKKEPEVQYEEVGFTLDDYLAQKESATSGLLAKKEVRAAEKITEKNVKDLDYKHDEMATTKVYKKVDTIPTKADANFGLLGFQATADAGEEFEAKGKRGNRQRDERPREPRANNNRGGRKGGKLVIDDNEFPAL